MGSQCNCESVHEEKYEWAHEQQSFECIAACSEI